ncbi:hypothetical protein N7508_006988 [Penicillium antarcticum]|uniref:uncharacterized protein n=1 Tax=Penicillium antarcticum TaxID=416450 RepID=UPI0023A0DF88|nr:uncharacterized protein N7508_006988 [Penicillium antarcticum]KAJ5302125.1 hypothetical protein N7508_006988 [Penicillium antarcticum]
MEFMMEEINVLRKFRGIPNIAQLAGLVISENPYKPNPCTKRPTVVTGFLVEYYPGGILQQTSENRDEVDADLPMRWTVQIGRALEPMHENGHAHLDMKRENVVLDAENRAIRNSSHRKPMRFLKAMKYLLLICLLGARVATDCWAYGRVLLALAEKFGSGNLRLVAEQLTKMEATERISLCDSLEKLEG